jgi:hypothetical protein
MNAKSEAALVAEFIAKRGVTKVAEGIKRLPPAQIRDGERLIAEVPKNRRDLIRVTRSTFNGHELVNIRVWTRAPDGTLNPTKAGIAFRAELLDPIIEALIKAHAAQ